MAKRVRALCVAALSASLAIPSATHAESITITARQPAKFSEPSQLRRMVIGNFSGRGGGQFAAALSQQMNAPGPDGPPYFTLVSSAGRAAGIGVISGSVDINVSQSNFVRQESRCVEGAKLFSCKRSVNVSVACAQRTSFATVNVQITRTSDSRVVYATSKPYRDVSTWCEGGPPAVDVDSLFMAVSDQIATTIVQEISPYNVRYKVRLLETTKDLPKTEREGFKAAIKTSMSNLPASCAAWNAMVGRGVKSAALTFDLGVCAEQNGDLDGAVRAYDQAAALAPGDKTVAEGVARARGLVAARATAAAQDAQRARLEAAERRKVQDAIGASRAAEATARRKERNAAAAVVAAKAQKRQEVAKTYGADNADAILSGTVRKGMTPSQVRAAVGGGCRIETLGPGEEQWFCGGRRYVFARGRVTYIK